LRRKEMSFELDEQYRMIGDVADQFAKAEIAPRVKELDKRGEFPLDIFKKMAGIGLLGIPVSTEYGGSGAGELGYVVVLEKVATYCAGTALGIQVTGLAEAPLEIFGNEEQKQKYLVPLAKGEKLGGLSLTEAHAGSDVLNIRCRAHREGEEYVINGTKSWASNLGTEIGIILLYTNPELKGKGMSTLIVERGMAGFRVGKHEEKIGLRANHTGDLIFENCRVPGKDLLGKEGDGLKIALRGVTRGRLGIGAIALGISIASLNAAKDYAKYRVAFGKAIGHYQAVQLMIADMAIEIEAARLLLYKGATMLDRGDRSLREISMAKVFASESALRITDKANEIHGAAGCSADYPVERYMRDARALLVLAGANEIQRMRIASEELKLE
jgi:alkylation response protein AidB-like acyl-CoA dehydrogenase